MSKPHLEILPESQKLLWAQFVNDRSLLDQYQFYLAGGTALALQLGHRQSLDFDFFSQVSAVTQGLSAWLRKFPDFILRDMDEHTVHAEISGVKISFIGGYRYPLVKALIDTEGIKMASVLDIGLMKLLAISHRATLRDYLDLAVIIRDAVPLATLLEWSGKKYGKSFNRMIPLRALISFQDIDEELPVLLDKTIHKTWQSILQKAVREIAR